MVDIGESSSSKTDSPNAKPVFVRVKRKSFQSPLEAFCMLNKSLSNYLISGSFNNSQVSNSRLYFSVLSLLGLEINERPLKRRPLDLKKLSISDSSDKVVLEECETKKILVQRVETVNSSEATLGVLQSFVPNSADAPEYRAKVEGRRHYFKQDDNRQDQLLSKARQKHEVLAKNARFEQIWKHRKGKRDVTHDASLHEICQLYDVVRIDPDEEIYDMMKETKDTSPEEYEILCNYMPLIREFLPSVAAEIQSDMRSYLSTGTSSDDYVYDLYTMQDEMKTTNVDDLNTYPLVQVEVEEDYFDGLSQSEYESDDSNAENNPLNEYPDEEEISEDEDEKSSSSNDESEEFDNRSSDDEPDQFDTKRSNFLSEHKGPSYVEEDIDDYDDVDAATDDDDDDDDDDNYDDDESWKWKYR